MQRFTSYSKEKNDFGRKEEKKKHSKINWVVRPKAPLSESTGIVQLDNTLSMSEDSKARFEMRDTKKLLKGLTHFHDFELEKLLHIYWKLTAKTVLNLTEFKYFLFNAFGIINSFTTTLLFNSLIEKSIDSNSKGQLSAVQFVRMLSVFCRGTLEEKIIFAFKAYDASKQGIIKENDAMNLIQKTFFNEGMDENQTQIYRPMEYFTFVLQSFDPHDRRVISYNDYREAVLKKPALLEALGQIFPDRLAIYAFLTTFTHLITTDHVIDVETLEQPLKVRTSKSLLKEILTESETDSEDIKEKGEIVEDTEDETGLADEEVVEHNKWPRKLVNALL